MSKSGNGKKENSVSIAFDLMRSELEIEVENLNSRGAEFFRKSSYGEAAALSERGKKLAEFCAKVDDLSKIWETFFADLFPEADIEQVEKISRTLNAVAKLPRSGLIIRFPNGDIIADRFAADTFANFVERVGLQRVEDLNLKMNGEPLVSDLKSKKYEGCRLRQGKFIKTHSNTKTKADFVLSISEKLGLDVEVQIVE